MSSPPDWEERCALALLETERTGIDAAQRLAAVRRILMGDLDPDSGEHGHDWRETGMDPLPGTAGGSPGHSIKYLCRCCGAVGYRIVFSTSETTYPIVSEAPLCRAERGADG
jgi:hypothetical protein